MKAGLGEVGSAGQATWLRYTRSINLVIEEFDRTNGPIVEAAHARKLGHPIFFTRALFEETEQINERRFGLKA